MTMLDPQAVLPAILIRSVAEAEDWEDREVSRWAGQLCNVFCARLTHPPARWPET